MVTSRYSLNKNKYLLPPEVQRLKEILQKFRTADTRNVLLLEVALNTGARAQEILNLKREDLNDYEQTVFIRGVKGSNDREIPVPEVLFKELRIYSATQSSSFLFPISYDRLLQIWYQYRPVQKKFHSLRHTFAINLYQKTKDIRLVQVALGHRNIANTMIYAEYVYSQTELRKLIL